jgi:hypothetical protein
LRRRATQQTAVFDTANDPSGDTIVPASVEDDGRVG